MIKISEGAFPIKKAIPIIVVTWILSLVTTLAVVYVAPNIFPIRITTENIADSAIITVKLADGTVTSAKILDGTITAVDIADGTIITIKVANGAITTAKIAEGSITTAKIADSAIVTVKLANETVTSEKIADGNVTTADLADIAVTTSKIEDDAIVTVKLADGSVTSAKILDGTITAADLATGAVTSMKIADGAVTTEKIADGSITATKLASDAIPYNTTYANFLTGPPAFTFSTAWRDIPSMKMNVTLSRKSTLLIMFSTEAWVNATNVGLHVLAWVNNTFAHPHFGLMPNGPVGITLLYGQTHATSYTFNFYLENVVPGTHEVKLQWKISTTGVAFMGDRTLTVIALPA